MPNHYQVRQVALTSSLNMHLLHQRLQSIMPPQGKSITATSIHLLQSWQGRHGLCQGLCTSITKVVAINQQAHQGLATLQSRCQGLEVGSPKVAARHTVHCKRLAARACTCSCCLSRPSAPSARSTLEDLAMPDQCFAIHWTKTPSKAK